MIEILRELPVTGYLKCYECDSPEFRITGGREKIRERETERDRVKERERK